MRLVLTIDSFIGVGMVLLYLEMARFIASDPDRHHGAVFDWPVPLALALVSAVLAAYFIRELIRDIRGMYP